MDDASLVLFLLIGLIAINQLFSRIPALHNSARGYLIVQVVNLTAATAAIVFGIPGFQDLNVVRWLLGLLLFWHVVRNNWTYQAARRKQQVRKREHTRQAIAQALDDRVNSSLEE